MVLITYDVDTTSEQGNRRLRKIAKICQNHGQRVQKSVFECLVEPYQYAQMKKQLEGVINPDLDSLRFYLLGSNWKKRVEHVGANAGYDVEGLLIT